METEAKAFRREPCDCGLRASEKQKPHSATGISVFCRGSAIEAIAKHGFLSRRGRSWPSSLRVTLKLLSKNQNTHRGSL